MLDIKVFEQKIEAAHARLENWLQRVESKSCDSDLLSETSEEMLISLEELHVAIEELYEQQEQLRAAQQLAQAESQRYLELFEFAPDGYIVTDTWGVTQEANRTAATLFNLRQDRLIGKPLTIFIPQPKRRAFFNLLHRLRQGEQIQEVELCMQPRQQSPLTIAISIATVRDEQNQLVALRWLLRDITQLKAAQIESQRQQERSQLIAEVTLKIRQSLQLEEILQTAVTEVQKLLQVERVLVVQFNSTDQGTVIKESTLPNCLTCPNMLGQKLVVPLLPADYIEKYRQGLSTASAYLQQSLTQPEEKELLRDFAIKASLNVPIFVQQKLWGLLVLHQCKNSRHWSEFEIDLSRQLADQIGIALSQSQLLTQMEELVAERTEELAETNQHLEQEIEERLQTEESLRQNQEQLQLITNALPVLISYVDANQRYRFNNKAYEDWFGKPVSEICGCHIRDVLGEPAYEQIREKVEAVLSGQNVTFEMELPYKDAGCRWVNITYIPHQGEGEKVLGFFSLINDITERKAIEQMKDEFVAVVSHELRTPLTSIHGSLRLLAAGKLGKLDAFSNGGQQMLNIAHRNTERLVRLVNDILDLQRLNSDKVTLEKHLCDAAELISTAVETMQEMARQQGITLSTAPVSIPVYADPDYILQTLTNLLSNAIKFSPANSTVWVQVENREADILFQVKDQGRGIPPDKLDNIFARFQQVDASDSRQKGGTGLGLAICRQIIELHGGKIWAESTLGEGSTFYFTLPKANPRENQIARAS